MCIRTPTPVDRQFEYPDEGALFFLEDSETDENERMTMFGAETVKKLISRMEVTRIFPSNSHNPHRNNVLRLSMYCCRMEQKKYYSRMIQLLNEINPHSEFSLIFFDSVIFRFSDLKTGSYLV